MKIKITKCSGEYYWYKYHIGKIFNAVLDSGGHYKVFIDKYGDSFMVDFDDTEVLKV